MPTCSELIMTQVEDTVNDFLSFLSSCSVDRAKQETPCNTFRLLISKLTDKSTQYNFYINTS